jgi:hypothetical protein
MEFSSQLQAPIALLLQKELYCIGRFGCATGFNETSERRSDVNWAIQANAIVNGQVDRQTSVVPLCRRGSWYQSEESQTLSRGSHHSSTGYIISARYLATSDQTGSRDGQLVHEPVLDKCTYPITYVQLCSLRISVTQIFIYCRHKCIIAKLNDTTCVTLYWTVSYVLISFR